MRLVRSLPVVTESQEMMMRTTSTATTETDSRGNSRSRHHRSGQSSRARSRTPKAKTNKHISDPLLDPRFELAHHPSTIFEPNTHHDIAPPIRISSLRKSDPLDPNSASARILAFPVVNKPGSVWYTDKSGNAIEGFDYKKITYEVVYSKEEEEAMRREAERAKAALQAKLAHKFRALQQSQQAESANAKAALTGKKAAAVVRLQEEGWRGRMGLRHSPSTHLLPTPPLRLRNDMELNGIDSHLERLPSPLRQAVREKEGEGNKESFAPLSPGGRSSVSSLHSLATVPTASKDKFGVVSDSESLAKAMRRHNRLPLPRHSTLDVRSLPLGSYGKGETSPVHKRDLEVLRVVEAARKSARIPVAGSMLSSAEQALFDIDYSRHLLAVLETLEKQRYVTEAEKRAIRAARRPKREEWRTITFSSVHHASSPDAAASTDPVIAVSQTSSVM